MPITRYSGPNAEPVTLEEMKEHLRVDWDDEDTYISDLITACRRLAGDWGNRSFVNEKWDEYFDQWPKGTNEMRLQKAPLQSVSSIIYVDTASATQTWASTNYTVVTASEPGRVVLKWAGSWPTNTLRPGLPIRVRYTSGYGTSAADVPQETKLLIKSLVAHFYENREPVIRGTIASKIPYHLETLLMQNQNWV